MKSFTVRPVGLALVGVMIVMSGSCSRSTAPTYEDDPDLVGRLAKVRLGGQGTQVLVNKVRVPSTGYDHGVALETGGAVVFVRRRDGTLLRGTSADIMVGAEIRAWTTGIELRSLPPQWSAVRIEVMFAPF